MNEREKAALEPIKGQTFCFDCRPDVECFTVCCAKLDLKLTPYDILRLSRRLDLKTKDFLDTYTTAVEVPGKLPRVALWMNEDDGRCPFVTDQGCTVYEDRPSACRTYPLARASSQGLTGNIREAYFKVREDHCKGFAESREWTVEQWMSNQGMDEYNLLNDLWMDVLTRQAAVLQSQDAERKVLMFNMASYDLDTFRTFVLEGGLLDRLEIPERTVKLLETDDVTLLKFGVAWLRLALFGEMSQGLTRP